MTKVVRQESERGGTFETASYEASFIRINFIDSFPLLSFSMR
ncbi:hypothetical protein [uncultured Chryseobacterium sp.]|nr:hypothetical protein [uncultured Chryseobacterium sp.]